MSDILADLVTPGKNLLAVTPSDSVNITNYPSVRGLWVGGAGNVAVLAADDSAAVTLVGVQAGTLIPLRVKRVNSTNTTATSIVAIY